MPNQLPRILRILFSIVVFLAFVIGFGYATGAANAVFYKLQFGPALMRCFAGGTVGALATVLAILGVTLLFGRFYCAFFCPLGILQDFIGWLAPGKARPVKNFRVFRYLIAALSIGFLIGGWSFGFLLFDPFTNFGRIASATITPGAVFLHEKFFPGFYLDVHPAAFLPGLFCLSVLIVLVVWKRRIFCTAVCPAGTLLGAFAGTGLFKLRLDGCVKCGRCATVCPAGCIDIENAAIDNERCVRCMNCLAACKPKRIRFTAQRALVAEDPGRRGFLTRAAISTAIAVVPARILAPGRRLAVTGNTPAICPPGAGSPARFASKCTACMLCAANCKGKVIQPPGNGCATVHLDFDHGMCEFNCNICSSICPTGALMPMTLAEKKRRRIGLAHFTPDICVAVAAGTHCGACAEHCPTGALRMVAPGGHGVPVPVLNEVLCIGCGSCEYPCPVRPEKAIVVKPVGIQVEAADPDDFFKRQEPETPATDEWLI